MTVRPATADDLEPVMAIERASFPTDAWSDSAMAEAFATADPFVAEDAAGVLGYGIVLAPHGSGDADVLTIAVAEAHRGGGHGSALLGRMLATAEHRRAHRVFLEVRADNPGAQRLYERTGFRAVGVRRRYYQPDGVDAVVMRLDLGGDR